MTTDKDGGDPEITRQAPAGGPSWAQLEEYHRETSRSLRAQASEIELQAANRARLFRSMAVKNELEAEMYARLACGVPEKFPE